MKTSWKLALVGFGAIGQALARQLRSDPALQLDQVVVRDAASSPILAACHALAPSARLSQSLDLSSSGRPDLLVECAGHAALDEHVLLALQAGVPCIVASVGAMHDDRRYQRLTQAAQVGGTQMHLVAGAIAAIDALSAAKLGGLESVHYVGRKPPLSWLGTPAEAVCDLRTLRAAQVMFRGSAREAARAFPKNANVAATVSLAGLGLDATLVELMADPGVQHNVHQIMAHGAFGKLDLRIENHPLAANPKTSALTVFSVLRAIRNVTRAVVI